MTSLSQVSPQETEWRSKSVDYENVFCGHCNITTDIKEAVFFGKLVLFIHFLTDDICTMSALISN